MSIFEAIEQKESAEQKIKNMQKEVALILKTSLNSPRIETGNKNKILIRSSVPEVNYNIETFEKLCELLDMEKWSFSIISSATIRIFLTKGEEENEETLSESENN